MKKLWWKNEREEKGKLWWNNLVYLFVAFAIAGAITFLYEELTYKKDIPIESMKQDWQLVDSNLTSIFEGRIYTCELYIDRLSIKKDGGKITVWMKIKPHEIVVQETNKKTVRWNEGIQRWNIDCKKKEIKVDYYSLYLDGKKQLSGKIDDLQLPVKEGTLSYYTYESLCF